MDSIISAIIIANYVLFIFGIEIYLAGGCVSLNGLKFAYENACMLLSPRVKFV